MKNDVVGDVLSLPLLFKELIDFNEEESVQQNRNEEDLLFLKRNPNPKS